MDKLNKINLNIGAIKNDLQQQAKKRVEEKKEEKAGEKPQIAHEQVDPDVLMEAMKKHGMNNLNLVMASGNVASKTITDAIDFFTSAVSPEMHKDLTDKVKLIFKAEFPAAQMDPEVITEVVDNMLFEALTA